MNGYTDSLRFALENPLAAVVILALGVLVVAWSLVGSRRR